MANTYHHNALQTGYMLNWYRITDVLGQGGFGITYLGHDENLQQDVAIKEYFPKEWAMRMPDASVQSISSNHEENVAWGLERFISEGRILAKYDHPAIVRVLSVFEANNTAYLIMRYEQGATLQDVLKHSTGLPEDEIKTLLVPILDGLRLMHASGVIHRDIKPDNIFIRSDGSPMLIDFGSARHAIGERTTDLTAVVSAGYAPIEQYAQEEGKQGPWTDVYGLGATVFKSMVGKPPVDALRRSTYLITQEKDPIESLRDLFVGKYDYKFLRAIDNALEFKPNDRPQSIDDFVRALDLEATGPVSDNRSSTSGKKKSIEKIDLSIIDTGKWEISDIKTEAAKVEPSRVEAARANIEEDYSLLVGSRARQYYLSRMKNMGTKSGGVPVSWNWSAALLTGLWFMYRKIYLWGLGIYPVIACGLLIAGFFIADTLYPGQIKAQLAALGAYLVVTSAFGGLFGTGIYRAHLLKRVRAARLLNLNAEDRKAWLEKKGGVNFALPMAVVVAMVAAGVGIWLRVVGA